MIISPVPTRDIVNIDIPYNNTEKTEVCLYTIEGKLLTQTICGDRTVQLDLSYFERGVYVLSIDNGADRYFEKIIKE